MQIHGYLWNSVLYQVVDVYTVKLNSTFIDLLRDWVSICYIHIFDGLEVFSILEKWAIEKYDWKVVFFFFIGRYVTWVFKDHLDS